jgi:hypothetical protein
MRMSHAIKHGHDMPPIEVSSSLTSSRTFLAGLLPGHEDYMYGNVHFDVSTSLGPIMAMIRTLCNIFFKTEIERF